MLHSQLINKLELLAPAKDLETAKAAILSGADAVFIGGPAFGARADACNSIDAIKEVCDFAHLFNVKVHVTLNTLLYDDEVSQAQELIDKLASIGVDVLIVQDLSIFTMNIPKGIELHASTQCCIDTVEKLKYFESLGVTQVVLPREFTLDKIKAFHDACPNIRLEAFVLGAICVGYSGICHISDYIKKRSANRGSCAQICRLPMQLFHDGKEIAVGHLLSLKDNYQGEHLRQLIDAGVVSFKVEGRLKDLEYVANTTAYISKKIDDILLNDHSLHRMSSGKTTLNFTPDIYKTFNRGFTDGLLVDDKTTLPNPITPKYLGQKVGVVKRVESNRKITTLEIQVSKNISLHNGDGLTYVVKPNAHDAQSDKISQRVCSVDGFRVNKVTIFNKSIVDVEVFGKVQIQPGTIIYRNVDYVFSENFTKGTYASRVVKYKINLCVQHVQDTTYKIVLDCSDECNGHAQGECTYEYDETLKTLSIDKIKQTLNKKVNDCALLDDVSFEGPVDKITLPISKLNELRKTVISSCIHDRARLNGNAQFIPFKLVDDKTIPTYPVEQVDERLVLNSVSKRMYELSQTSIGATGIVSKSLMKCKFCLINEYGTCSKKGGKVSGYTLAVSGKVFKIQVDCKNCFMHIINE